MLSTQAFNALLQILEEPPAHLMFILATTEIHKVPATIKSRCQQFSFRRIHADQITGRLRYVAGQEGLDLTAEGAALIARLADGGMRDALSLLDQCVGGGGTIDQQRVFDTLGLAGGLETAALLERAADGDTAGALEQLERLYAGGKEMSALIGELSALVRDLLVRKTAPNAGSALMTGGFDDTTLRRLTGRFDVPRLVQMLTLLQKTGADLARSANRRTDAELCLLTLCDPTLDGSIAGLTARVARLEQGGVPAAPAPAAERPAPAPQPVQAQPRRPAPEERPPWEEPEPAPVRREEPVPTSPPAPEAKPAARPAPQPASAGSWPGWNAFKEALRPAIPVSDFSFFSMCGGSFDGRTVTLWTANDFIRDMLSKPAITGPVAKTAERLLGVPVRVNVATGTAPAETAPAAPVSQPLEGEEDALEAFLAGSLGNIIVED